MSVLTILNFNLDLSNKIELKCIHFSTAELQVPEDRTYNLCNFFFVYKDHHYGVKLQEPFRVYI